MSANPAYGFRALFQQGADCVAATINGQFLLVFADGATHQGEDGRSELIRLFPEQAREVFALHAQKHARHESAMTSIRRPPSAAPSNGVTARP